MRLISIREGIVGIMLFLVVVVVAGIVVVVVVACVVVVVVVAGVVVVVVAGVVEFSGLGDVVLYLAIKLYLFLLL